MRGHCEKGVEEAVLQQESVKGEVGVYPYWGHQSVSDMVEGEELHDCSVASVQVLEELQRVYSTLI